MQGVKALRELRGLPKPWLGPGCRVEMVRESVNGHAGTGATVLGELVTDVPGWA